MKRKGICLLSFLLGLGLLMGGCSSEKTEDPSSGKIPDGPVMTPQVSEEPVIFEPDPELIDEYSRTWIYLYYDNDRDTEISCRLILSSDQTAQMPVQNGIGELLGLYFGSWSLNNGHEIHLELIPDDMNETLDPLSGDYDALFTDYDSLTLTCLGSASPLVPGHSEESAIFFDETSLLDPSGEKSEERVCQAALNYVEERSGEPYPGVAVAEGWEDGMILVHLYEDMGDHTATLGWYLIDPVSLIGYDNITSEQIDFAPYAGFEG